MTVVTQVRFLSLSRMPELQGKDPDTIKGELARIYGGRSEDIHLDLRDPKSPMAIIRNF
jgi:hypothetical protein